MPHQTSTEAPAAMSANLRNEPVQARSTARLTRLLDAAAEVVDEIGFERLTTAMVAERAGASIGTVYRYFPDRIALLQALSIRATTDFIEISHAVVRDQSHSDWAAAFDEVLRAYEQAFEKTSGFSSLRFGDVIDLRPAETSNTAAVAEAIADALTSRFDMKVADLSYHVEVALLLADSLFARAFTISSQGEKRFRAMAKTAAREHLAQQVGASA